MTVSIGSGGKGMGRDQQLDEGQNPHSHKQKGRTKEKPFELLPEVIRRGWYSQVPRAYSTEGQAS